MSEAFRKGILKREAIFTMGIAADELGLSSSKETILIQGIIDAYIEPSDRNDRHDQKVGLPARPVFR